jgi:hypothetical protein
MTRAGRAPSEVLVSLVKGPKMTVRKLAAIRPSLKLSHGPATLQESPMGSSPYGRAAEIAPTHRHAALMRRMQDSNFRQVVRLTSLLLRMKRQERQMEGLENPAACCDLSEKKWVRNRDENLSKLHPIELKRVNLLRGGGGGGEKRGPQNEGKSNDVVENKGRKNVSLGF